MDEWRSGGLLREVDGDAKSQSLNPKSQANRVSVPRTKIQYHHDRIETC